MEPKFQTSFIPKNPISTSSSPSYRPVSSSSIIGTFATLFFTLALLVSGALFGYEFYIEGQIKQSQVQLVEAKSAFESADNQKLILASNQIKSIKTLLDKHTVVSPIFKLLEDQTLPTVRFTSFAFSRDSLGGVTVSIEGEAQSYASLAQQSSILLKLPYLSHIEFSDITLSDSGTVRMKVRARIDSEVLMYNKKIQGVSTVPSNSLHL